jgi:hypothetical protein
MNTTNEQRLQMAEVHIHDAMQNVISDGTRASAAFDAGYTWLLVALDAPTGLTHPGIEEIQNGIKQFHVSPREMAPALEFLNRQYTPEGVDDLLQELLVWAQQMKELADAA